MTAPSWACAALLCWHLGATGALPREVPADLVRPYATGRQPIRVLIFKDADSLTIRPDASFAIQDHHTGERLATALPGANIEIRPASRGLTARGPGLRITAPRLLLLPLAEDGAATISSRGGWGRRASYPGALDIAPSPGGLRVVAHLDLETYVAGVVPAEMPSNFPPEALKAQAIAARTYALHHLGDHAADDADICARVHCQAYLGRPSAASAPARAARDTAGLVLTWNGLLLDSLYHSACGGATAPAWNVRQGKLLPYLRGSSDSPPSWISPHPYCGHDHDLDWEVRFSRREADRLISSNLSRVLAIPGLSPGELESLAAMYDPDHNRVAWLDITTTAGEYRVRGDAIRWLFGTGYAGPTGLRSTAFSLTVETDRGGDPTAFLFQGVGHGHGLGLCQWGARGRALAGQSADEILQAYYPGASLTDLRW